MAQSSQHIRELSPGLLQVQGALNFVTAKQLLTLGEQFIAAQTEVTFDLQAITSSNSAGLALLTGWWRAGQTAHKTVRFINIPAHLQAMAKVCGVASLLQLESITHG